MLLHRERLLEAADIAEKKAAHATEPSVKETLLALVVMYRDMAEQLEELELLRRRLHHQKNNKNLFLSFIFLPNVA